MAPAGVRKEGTMSLQHRELLPLIMVKLTLVVKITVRKR